MVMTSMIHAPVNSNHSAQLVIWVGQIMVKLLRRSNCCTHVYTGKIAKISQHVGR